MYVTTDQSAGMLNKLFKWYFKYLILCGQLIIGQNIFAAISENELDDIVDVFLLEYSETANKQNKILTFNKKWVSNDPNAYAHNVGRLWKIEINGALARHWAITKEAMVMSLCHEMGHFMTDQKKSIRENELAADRFAINECARRIFNVTRKNTLLLIDAEIPICKNRDVCIFAYFGSKQLRLLFENTPQRSDYPTPSDRWGVYLNGLRGM